MSERRSSRRHDLEARSGLGVQSHSPQKLCNPRNRKRVGGIGRDVKRWMFAARLTALLDRPSAGDMSHRLKNTYNNLWDVSLIEVINFAVPGLQAAAAQRPRTGTHRWRAAIEGEQLALAGQYRRGRRWAAFETVLGHLDPGCAHMDGVQGEVAQERGAWRDHTLDSGGERFLHHPAAVVGGAQLGQDPLPPHVNCPGPSEATHVVGVAFFWPVFAKMALGPNSMTPSRPTSCVTARQRPRTSSAWRSSGLISRKWPWAKFDEPLAPHVRRQCAPAAVFFFLPAAAADFAPPPLPRPPPMRYSGAFALSFLASLLTGRRAAAAGLLGPGLAADATEMSVGSAPAAAFAPSPAVRRGSVHPDTVFVPAAAAANFIFARRRRRFRPIAADPTGFEPAAAPFFARRRRFRPIAAFAPSPMWPPKRMLIPHTAQHPSSDPTGFEAAAAAAVFWPTP
ncbi:hypothetical protein B0H11DRAFT_2290998 [Mycena galericulata]|nr:hypothetical protein B0H11DRAFT_2290998 [Mycena galericulata]